MHRTSTLALIATLTACSAEVVYYSSETETDDHGRPVATVDLSEAPPSEPTTTTGTVPEPEPCEGDAQCWPDGYCDADLGCQPQDLTHCLVGGVLTDCTGAVCCNFGGGHHECLPAGDCEPDGGPTPP